MYAECQFEVITYLPICKYTYLQDMQVKRVKYKHVFLCLKIPLKDTSLIGSAEVKPRKVDPDLVKEAIPEFKK